MKPTPSAALDNHLPFFFLLLCPPPFPDGPDPTHAVV